MSIRALILGASGYGGGELWRYLLGHPEVEGIQGTSRQHTGRPVSDVHPNLRRVDDSPFIAEPDWAWLNDAEHSVLFAAMPHGEFSRLYADLAIPEGTTVIDLSADFRIQDTDRYARFYRTEHPNPAVLPAFVYGLPELNRAAIGGARRIANPGCFATALQLALLPLRGTSVEFVAASGVTGSSGSGMSPSDTTHHPTRSSDFRAYKALGHQHIAEVEQMAGETRVSFVPHSGPFVRGIFLTAQFQITSSLGGLVEAAFPDAPFVRFVKGSPRVSAVAGTNFADIAWAQDGDLGTIMVALDNLGKGMSGQAVQNMNLALGLPETAGLLVPGPYPI